MAPKKKMKTDLQIRLKQAQDYSGLTQVQIAERVRKMPSGANFSQQAYSKLIRGEDEKTAYIVHIALANHVNPEWLALGQGEMVRASDKIRSINSMNAEAVDLARMWASLPPEIRGDIKGQIRVYFDQSKAKSKKSKTNNSG